MSIRDPKTPAKTEKGRERMRGLLSHAIDVFIELGYERASLEKIIKKSGGSRSTVYECYGNKEGLFIAALEMMADDIYNAYIAQYRHGRSLKEDLLAFAHVFLEGILHKRSLGAMRLIYAESSRLPQIGQWYYQEGILASYHCLAKVLENHLNAPMPQLIELSAHFIEMLKGPLYHKAMCLPQFECTVEDIEKEAHFCTAMMLIYIDKEFPSRQTV